MSKLVVLNLGRGGLQTGFPFVSVLLQTKDSSMQFTGSLPAAPDLDQLYRRWQLLYQLLYQARCFNLRIADDDDFVIDETDITNVSDGEFQAVCQQLEQRINSWLDARDFRPAERQLRKQLTPDDEIRFIIQTEDNQLRKLPWAVWSFFADYRRAEVSLSPLNFAGSKPLSRNTGQVRILAILGDRTGIDLEADRRLLQSLPNAEVVFLVEGDRTQLNEQLWHPKGWDMLFFAGHSSSFSEGKTGKISISPTESLSVSQLKNALNKAVERGLQLAIFNSCEGLGLARQLSDLQIGQMIVMREPVPDRVAQEFLKHFLAIFAQGTSFGVAVREAREKLQGIETDFPGASWLPVIFQNPAGVPLNWQQLRNLETSSSLPRPKIARVLLTSLAVATMLVGIRWLGLLQGCELRAFDHLQRQMPREMADERLLIVGADEADISSSGYGYPLPDRVLAQLVDKLESYRPAAIGIDIFRDQPVPKNDLSDHQALITHFDQNANLVAICAGKNLDNSIAPPPEVSPTQVGFIDLYDDRNQSQRDDTIRRYLLSRSPNSLQTPSRCQTPYSFGWQLAYRYFTAQNIPVETIAQDWQFGSVIFKRLQSHSGGYQNLDERGNQLLMRYRNTPQIAQQVTVKDVLEETEKFNPAWVEGRIVLIGVTASSVQDFHDTPFGEKRGIDLHAHALSQILSAVENQRSLFWWFPPWLDALWIGFWSTTGGVIIWYWQRPLYRVGAVGVAVIVLYGVCWLIFTEGGWLPLVPSTIAVVATAASVVLFTQLESS